jgi:hypothetical protein
VPLVVLLPFAVDPAVASVSHTQFGQETLDEREVPIHRVVVVACIFAPTLSAIESAITGASQTPFIGRQAVNHPAAKRIKPNLVNSIMPMFFVCGSMVKVICRWCTVGIKYHDPVSDLV